MEGTDSLGMNTLVSNAFRSVSILFELDYSSGATDNIKMYFTYNGDKLGGIDSDFAVIISENKDDHCGVGADGNLGSILFKSNKAIVDNNLYVTTPDTLQGIFSATLASNTGETEVTLLIKTVVDKFRYPIYEEKNENCNEDVCNGKLKFCVELQSIVCGVKMDAIDVAVAINIDLRVDCDACGPDVILTHAEAINDGGTTKIGQIEVKPCA